MSEMTSNERSEIDGISASEFATALHTLQYRKSYNARTEVRAARKERMKVVMEWVKQHGGVR